MGQAPNIEHPNASVVRRLYAAFAQGDMETARSCFVEDAIWHMPGKSPIGGDHVGSNAILRDFFTKLRELSCGSFRAELTDVLANDQHAVALQHATAKRGTKHLDVTACQLMRIRDGRILEVRGYYSDQYALDEFWS
jgi:ketosteroid isomerase-like protein